MEMYGLVQILESKFDGIDWIAFNSSNGLNNNQVYSVDEDSFGNIWVGTHSGVSFYDGNFWLSYGYPDLHWSGVNRTAFDSKRATYGFPVL